MLQWLNMIFPYKLYKSSKKKPTFLLSFMLFSTCIYVRRTVCLSVAKANSTISCKMKQNCNEEGFVDAREQYCTFI